MIRTAVEDSKKKRGVALISGIVMLALAAWLVMSFMSLAHADDRKVQIIDGEGRQHLLSLSDEGEHSFTTELGTNTITIEKGQVRMSSADCPNQDCVHLGDIHSAQEVILCLPNQFMVNIVDADPNATTYVDSISG